MEEGQDDIENENQLWDHCVVERRPELFITCRKAWIALFCVSTVFLWERLQGKSSSLNFIMFKHGQISSLLEEFSKGYTRLLFKRLKYETLVHFYTVWGTSG